MQSNTLKPNKGSRKGKKRVGRGNGSGHGTTATRGTKGQRARTGGRSGLQRLGFRFTLQRIPKRRGFTSFAPDLGNVVTLQKVAEAFESGAIITPKAIKKHGLASSDSHTIKIVGRMDNLNKKFTIKGCTLTAGAKESIEKAGGKVE